MDRMTAAPRPRAWQRRWLVAGTLAVLCVLPLAGTGWAQTPASGQIETEPPAAGPPEPAGTGEQQQQTAPKPRVEGGQVTVTAERIDVPLAENPAATSVVDESVLSTIPRGVAADEGLALVPGVTVDNQANSARVHLSIRGQGILTEHGIRGITVRLDGIPLNDPTGFVPDLYDVDWSTVDRIEVLRGPASALYGGGGSGGVLNIETAGGEPRPIAGRTAITLGSNGFAKVLAQASGTSDGASYRISASRTLGDGYRVHTAFDATNLYGKVHLDRGGPFRLSMVVMGTAYFNESAEGLNLEQVQEDPQQANPDALKYNEFQDTHRGTLGLVGSWDLAPGQQLGLTVYGRATGYRGSVPSSIIHRQFASYGASLQYSVESKLAGFANRFSAGLDLDWQDIDELRHPNLGDAVEGPERLADQSTFQRAAGLFLLDRMQLGKGWSILGGLRTDDLHYRLDDALDAGGVDRSGAADYSETTGRLGIAWNLRPSLGFYAAWGQGFLPPATEELASNPESLGGFNESLHPATSRSIEAGVRAIVKSRLTLDASVFRLLTEGDFGRYRMPERPHETFYRNAGDSRRWGVETELAWFPAERFTLRLAYTYSNFRYDTVAVGDEILEDTWLPNSPRHMASLDLQLRVGPSFTLGALAKARSRAYIDATNATWIDGYGLLDLRAAWRFQLGSRTGGELRFAVRNVTDTAYIAFTEPDPDGNSYQPGPGREWFVGAVLHL